MSLLPTKHSHPDKTTLALAVIIIKRLKKVRIEEYDKLLGFLQKKNSNAKSLFLSSMNFLYLMGLVNYHKKTDSFEYVGL
ncbi:MAG: hypothetical protein GXO60_01080 [Epsilonproteobacteria bacterium]|nr:hypothetical protein [Campylobacterota bacterium]